MSFARVHLQLDSPTKLQLENTPNLNRTILHMDLGSSHSCRFRALGHLQPKHCIIPTLRLATVCPEFYVSTFLSKSNDPNKSSASQHPHTCFVLRFKNFLCFYLWKRRTEAIIRAIATVYKLYVGQGQLEQYISDSFSCVPLHVLPRP